MKIHLCSFWFLMFICFFVISTNSHKSSDILKSFLRRFKRTGPPYQIQDVQKIVDMFKDPTKYRNYRKKVPTKVRLPTYAEISAKKVLVTYVKDKKNPGKLIKETSNQISKDKVIARNPEQIGVQNGHPVYNEWLIPKTEFFKNYDAKPSDMSTEFKDFHKKMLITAIEVTPEIIKLLGGKNGKATIKVDWGTMDVLEGGLLTKSYSISPEDRKNTYEQVKSQGRVFKVLEPADFHMGFG